mmetsp:Transcript_47831/g.83758  ORF Transcript_47831/g.83758 Transcript_47831/m.83758 type:complete len:261 (-) Transcript_47831:6663-7445(-)
MTLWPSARLTPSWHTSKSRLSRRSWLRSKPPLCASQSDRASWTLNADLLRTKCPAESPRRNSWCARSRISKTSLLPRFRREKPKWRLPTSSARRPWAHPSRTWRSTRSSPKRRSPVWSAIWQPRSRELKMWLPRSTTRSRTVCLPCVSLSARLLKSYRAKMRRLRSWRRSWLPRRLTVSRRKRPLRMLSASSKPKSRSSATRCRSCRSARWILRVKIRLCAPTSTRRRSIFVSSPSSPSARSLICSLLWIHRLPWSPLCG